MGPFARALIEGSALLSLPLVSLTIFTLTFAAVVARALRAKPALIDELSRLPLEERSEEQGR